MRNTNNETIPSRVETTVTCDVCGNEVPLLKALHREFTETVRQKLAFSSTNFDALSLDEVQVPKVHVIRKHQDKTSTKGKSHD